MFFFRVLFFEQQKLRFQSFDFQRINKNQKINSVILL
jgi:hypothetical protein